MSGNEDQPSGGNNPDDVVRRRSSVPHHPRQAEAGRGEARERAFNIPPVVLATIAVCVGVHLLRSEILNANADFALLLRTAFIPFLYSGDVEFDLFSVTAPVTYSLLHGDFIHLGINMVWLAAFGSPLANRIGWGRFILFWIATSVASAALFYAFNPLMETPLVGASGAISGMMGAAARFGFQIDRSRVPPGFSGPALSVAQALQSTNVLVFLAAWLAINLLTGLLGGGPGVEGQIAWEAHLGGFLVGFFALTPFLAGRHPSA